MSTSTATICARRALRWVLASERALPRSDLRAPLRRVDLAASLRLLVLAALCCDIDPTLVDQVRPLVGALKERIEGGSESDLYAMDGSTVVLAALVLEQVERPQAPLLSGYMSMVARALTDVPPTQDSSSARMARIVVARQGRCEIPPAERLYVDVASLTGGDETSLRSALSAIDRASSFGVVCVDAMPEVAHWIECAALNALQSYRLDLAAEFARRARYVGGVDGVCSSQIRAFIAAHQAPTGEFGFYDDAIAAMRAHVPEPYAALSVLLPATLACLWYLAEHDLCYRMLRNLGRGAYSGAP